MNRTKLCDRVLPDYTPAEEMTNMLTHIIGGVMGVAALVLCVCKAGRSGSAMDIVTVCVFGAAMVCLYAMSSVYHGLKPSMGKKVMQVLDHCTIYLLIAGTYTPIMLGPMREAYPAIGWGLFGAEWLLAATAATLTAIDLKKYRIFSMLCYIGMGWSIVFFLPQAWEVLTAPGFWLVFAGGIAYTIGAVLYGIGGKRRWFHSVFHVFVVLGSLFHALAIFFYVL